MAWSLQRKTGTLRAAMLWSDQRAQVELERYRMATHFSLRTPRKSTCARYGRSDVMLVGRTRDSLLSEGSLGATTKGLATHLTDEAATDPSDASATLLYDLQAEHWADDIIEALGLKRHLLPPIIPSGTIAGRLSTRAAEVLNLPVGLPVATRNSL
jgi:xylulokinase